MNNEDPLTADPNPTQPVEEQPSVEQKPAKENRKKPPYTVIIAVLSLLLLGSIAALTYLYFNPKSSPNATNENSMSRVEQTSAAGFINSVQQRVQPLNATYEDMRTIIREQGNYTYFYPEGSIFFSDDSFGSVSLTISENYVDDSEGINESSEEFIRDAISRVEDILRSSGVEMERVYQDESESSGFYKYEMYQNNVLSCTIDASSTFVLICGHLDNANSQRAEELVPYANLVREDDTAITMGGDTVDKRSVPEGSYNDTVWYIQGLRGMPVSLLSYYSQETEARALMAELLGPRPVACSNFNTAELRAIFEGYSCLEGEEINDENMRTVQP